MPTMKRMLGSRAALALRIIESAHDISERKQAEEALRESEDKCFSPRRYRYDG
jgi:PAS domain-containing protein